MRTQCWYALDQCTCGGVLAPASLVGGYSLASHLHLLLANKLASLLLFFEGFGDTCIAGGIRTPECTIKESRDVSPLSKVDAVGFVNSDNLCHEFVLPCYCVVFMY